MPDWFHAERQKTMKEKRISKPTPKADVPYDAANAGDVTAFWETATKHRGVEELRAKTRATTQSVNEARRTNRASA